MMTVSLVLVFIVFVQGISCQNAEIELSICDPLSQRQARLVHVSETNAPTDHGQHGGTCTCTFKGISLNVLFRFLYLHEDGNNVPLSISYTMTDGKHGTWPNGNMSSSERKQDAIVMASNVKDVKIEVDQYVASQGQIFFLIDVQVANLSADILFVECNSSHTAPGPDTTTEESLVEKLCSIQSIIIIGSCLLGLCFVTLLTTICICCSMRKKRHTLEVSRNEGVAVYDDATVKLRHNSDAQQLAPMGHGPGVYSNAGYDRGYRRSNSMPMGGNNRANVVSAQYANTTDIRTFRE